MQAPLMRKGGIAGAPRSDNRPDGDRGVCFAVTIFTRRWREIRDFYVELLGAKVRSEERGLFSEMELGGLPVCLRSSEYGELVSYFHLHIALEDREPVLRELQRRGIVVTRVGPYVNFRDPEGRVIKLAAAPVSLN